MKKTLRCPIGRGLALVSQPPAVAVTVVSEELLLPQVIQSS